MKSFLRRVEEELLRIDKKRPWLAKETGLRPGTVNSWFVDDRYPRLDHAHKVAKALGLSLDYLVEGGNRSRDMHLMVNVLQGHLKPIVDEYSDTDLVGIIKAFANGDSIPRTFTDDTLRDTIGADIKSG